VTSRSASRRARRCAAAAALAAWACAVGPNYRRPDLSLPADYRGALAPEGAASLANRPWWDLYRDPALVALVDRALQENLDVKVAAARVEQARAAVLLARAPIFPAVDAIALGLRQSSGGAPTPGASAGAAGAAAAAASASGATQFWEAGVAASWELDVWGKYRRATEAARAQLLASEMGRRAAVTSVVADVARAWIQLSALTEALQITRDSIASAEQSLALVRRLAAGGVQSEAEVRQAELQLLTFQVQLPSLERQRLQLEDALSVLLGRPPEGVPTPSGSPDLVPGPEIPAGLPSELLERRPDVAAAEQALVAANADVGVARAAFFPSISLTGLFGVVSGTLGDLLSRGRLGDEVTGSLSLPLFAGGANVANERIARARAKEAALEYRSTVLGALRDVADALAEAGKRREEVEGQRRRVTASKDAFGLVTERFQAGVASYLDVLDAQRSLYAARIDLSSAYAARQLGVVRLYQALGGGWTPRPGPAATAARAP